MKNFLEKPRIEPVRAKVDSTIADLIGIYRASGAFQGGRLGEAALLYQKMINSDTTVGLTLSGAMTPAGMGGLVIQLMEYGFVDMIISTGANLYHDMHFALDLAVYQGDFHVDDCELLEAGIERIYDVFITEKLLLSTDEFVQNALGDFKVDRPVSTSQIHYCLGQKLLKQAKYPEKSILAMAAKYDVPVYTSSPGDSSIGMNIAYMHMKNKNIPIDTNLDVIETSAIVFGSAKNGVIIVGGGSPKNFYLQTQPFLSQIAGMESKGHDFDIQISTDAPHWGGLSGATPSEAISWGKVNPDEIKNSVVVYSDATIVLPILTSYVLSVAPRKNLKRLYLKLPDLVKNLDEHVK